MASYLWRRFGQVDHYLEPFCGSMAGLLARPNHSPTDVETVNDFNGLLVNFWRAIKHDPEAVAKHAEEPLFEVDYHAREMWLVERKAKLRSKLEGDPDWYNAKAAGWWVWGMACKIGGGFCDGVGPWRIRKEGDVRRLVRVEDGDPDEIGITRPLPNMGGGNGIRGVTVRGGMLEWFQVLADRLKNVRICCGDWSRVCCSHSTTTVHGVVGCLMDPPYKHATTAGKKRTKVYEHDGVEVAEQVAEWCREHGDDKRYRIILCGYEGEHDLPGWECISWKAIGGYGNQRKTEEKNENRHRERLWVSPHCVPAHLTQVGFFDELGGGDA